MRQGRRSLRFMLVAASLLGAAVLSIEIGRRLGNNDSYLPGATEMAGNGSTAGYPRELRDGTGSSLILASRPERIVSQTLATDEILLEICAPDRIAGVSGASVDELYSPIAEQVRSLKIAPRKTAEEILRAEPDLIFIAAYSRAEVVDLLSSAGAPVFRFAAYDRLDDIKANIHAVGYAVGEDERAAALIARMERDIEAIRSRVPPGVSGPRIVSVSGGVTAAGNTLFDDIARTVGAINVPSENGQQGFPKISSEQIAVWDPDYLVTGADPNKFDQAVRDLLADPAIGSTKAARERRIIVVDNRYYLSISHNVVKAIEALANGLYGSAPAKPE